jgi:hypothetical protein
MEKEIDNTKILVESKEALMGEKGSLERLLATQQETITRLEKEVIQNKNL